MPLETDPPHTPTQWNRLAHQHRARREFDLALVCYHKVLKAAPINPAIHADIGNLLLEMARVGLPKNKAGTPDVGCLSAKHPSWAQLNASARAHREAVKLDPTAPRWKANLAETLNLIAVALLNDKQLRASLAFARETVALGPSSAAGWSNLGNVLRELKFARSAIECHQRAVSLAPESSDLLYNLAGSYTTAQQPAKAVETLNRALALKPGDPHLRWNLALNHLMLGNYPAGWQDYEARKETGGLPERNPPGKPWDGRSYAGESLLVLSEQGFGDTIWASRYLRQVKALGGELIVECRKEMVPLIGSMGVADKVVAKGTPFPPADRHIHICSVPGLYVRSAEKISGGPYIRAPQDRLAKAREAITGAKGKLRVGFVWSGSPGFRENHDRSAPLRLFLDALLLPGVQLYSLQKGPPAAELKSIPTAPIIDLGPALEDFADTAAVVAQLDLVIMTDSAVAHLAGAMGKSVWLLLNHGAYWMWPAGHAGSQWYQSMRLFRAKTWNDWNGVFDEASAALIQYLRNMAS